MSNVNATAVERLYGSTEALNAVLDATPGSGLPTWTGKPKDASITEWGIEQLWTADHGRHDHGNLADPADEQLVILAALDGDEDAWLSLLRAYIPAARTVVARHRASALDNEDVRQTALEGFIHAVQDFDTDKGHERVEQLVKRQVSHALADQYGTSFVASVPKRTRQRIAQILRAADGDATLAEELAPDFGMSVRTFRDAYEGLTALQPVTPLADLDAPSLAEPTTVEDAALVESVLRSDLSANERTALILAHGLGGEEPMNDGKIAERIGVSRSRAAHIRLDALAKVRAYVIAEER